MNNYLLYKKNNISIEFQISITPTWNYIIHSFKYYTTHIWVMGYIPYNSRKVIKGNDLANFIISNFPDFKNILLNYKSIEMTLIKEDKILNEFLNLRLTNYKNINLILKEINL